MSQSATAVYRVPVPAALPLEASFDGGASPPMGGCSGWMKRRTLLGLCAALAACIPDWRRGPVRHHRGDACCASASSRSPVGMRTRTMRRPAPRSPAQARLWPLPETGRDLASQPTFSRLENAVDRRTCYRLAAALLRVYLRERGRDGIPTHLVLDLDSTADPTHGQQEGSAYHGYYGQHMYHPLLIFDGETDQLLTAVLRPGNAHGSTGVVAVLKRIVRALRARWPR